MVKSDSQSVQYTSTQIYLNTLEILYIEQDTSCQTLHPVLKNARLRLAPGRRSSATHPRLVGEDGGGQRDLALQHAREALLLVRGRLAEVDRPGDVSGSVPGEGKRGYVGGGTRTLSYYPKTVVR